MYFTGDRGARAEAGQEAKIKIKIETETESTSKLGV